MFLVLIWFFASPAAAIGMGPDISQLAVPLAAALGGAAVAMLQPEGVRRVATSVTERALAVVAAAPNAAAYAVNQLTTAPSTARLARTLEETIEFHRQRDVDVLTGVEHATLGRRVLGWARRTAADRISGYVRSTEERWAPRTEFTFLVELQDCFIAFDAGFEGRYAQRFMDQVVAREAAGLCYMTQSELYSTLLARWGQFSGSEEARPTQVMHDTMRGIFRDVCASHRPMERPLKTGF